MPDHKPDPFLEYSEARYLEDLLRSMISGESEGTTRYQLCDLDFVVRDGRIVSVAEGGSIIITKTIKPKVKWDEINVQLTLEDLDLES